MDDSHHPPPSRDAVAHITIGRVAGGRAITEFLRAHARSRPRGRIDRAFGASVLTEQSRPHYQQALAERAVAAELDRLGDDWVVLHALPIDSAHGDLDHVVIGPPGIFSLSSHHFGGQGVSARDGGFHVGRQRENHIRDAEFDMGRVERRLAAAAGRPLHVIGVIVVVRGRVGQLRGLPRDITVFGVADLLEWLRSLPAQLDRSCIDRITEVALQPGTWVPLAPERGVAPEIGSRFETVREEVDAATRLHRLWLVALSAGVLGLLGFATWGVVLQASMP